ncbi:MutS-related protein [Proteiniphilum sp. UBA1028]|uniref:MutS-related protein n=1 Tax=Proteiniphilum sp. UBA1028 TaxID=1947251 RepID=UPI0025F76432|nr:hypothetical protein [Proteiniphilum sp. UBA1028]
MSFLIDKQTLDDLNILGKYAVNSIYSLFNVVITAGGEKLLNKYFHNLLNDHESINKRSQLFCFFQNGDYQFPIKKEDFVLAEAYLTQTNYSNPLNAFLHATRVQFLRKIGLDKEYQILKEGMIATTKVFRSLTTFGETFDNGLVQNPFALQCETLKTILNNKQLQWIKKSETDDKITFIQFAKYDYVLRYALKNELAELLHIIYEIDVNIAVAKVAEKEGFSYAKAYSKERNFLSFEELFHPCVNDAVGNDIEFSDEKNVVFLTGANMAGKSTLMKAIGVAVYLAHMGFPIPAKKFEFSVKDGIFTSINVPDNLHLGYSHFYAEVLRVKNIAEAVISNRYLLILFDELFKGTNVKDAYDATVHITKAFSKKIFSSFIISTHIMEAGVALQKEETQIQFLYLPTVMKGVIPIYTYKLQKGISDDRHGMVIIGNEKIIEIINGAHL